MLNKYEKKILSIQFYSLLSSNTKNIANNFLHSFFKKKFAATLLFYSAFFLNKLAAEPLSTCE